MLSLETRNVIDVAAAAYFAVNKLLDELHDDLTENELELDNLLYGDIFDELNKNFIGSWRDWENVPRVVPNKCADTPCQTCGWHADAAENALRKYEELTKEGRLDSLTEDDGVNSAKFRKILVLIFEEVSLHYNYAKNQNGNVYGTTVRDSCTRRFNNRSTDDFYKLFLQSLTSNKPNPMFRAIINNPVGDQTLQDIEYYIRSIGLCVGNWLL